MRGQARTGSTTQNSATISTVSIIWII
jgi:hypothetical protein